MKVLGSVASSMYGTTYPLVLTHGPGPQRPDARILHECLVDRGRDTGRLRDGAFGRFFGPRRLARYGLAARAGLVLLFSVLVDYAADAADGAGLRTTERWPSEPNAHRTRCPRRCHASVLHALAAHILATSLTTQTTGLVAADEQGALLGLEHALFAGARVVGPILGTSVLAAGRRVKTSRSSAPSSTWRSR